MSSDKISFQKNIKMTSNLWEYSIDDIYNFVKTGCSWSMDIKADTERIRKAENHDIQNKLKEQLLPYACFNGIFNQRNDACLLEYSSYTAVDFDQFRSQEELNVVGNKLVQTPFVQMAFMSPSGKGLKAIIKHTNTNPRKHKAMYGELLKYFNYPEVDSRTSDLSRATYLCYDPYAYWNSNCQPFQFDEKVFFEDSVMPQYHVRNYIVKNNSYSDKISMFEKLRLPQKTNITDDSIIRILGSWHKKVDGLGTNRNNRLYFYAAMLCKAGVSYRTAQEWLTSEFMGIGLSEEEILKTTVSAYSHYYDEFGSERDSKFHKKFR